MLDFFCEVCNQDFKNKITDKNILEYIDKIVYRIVQFYTKKHYKKTGNKYIQKFLSELPYKDIICNDIKEIIDNFDIFIGKNGIIKSKVNMFLRKKYALLKLQRDQFNSITLKSKLENGKIIIDLNELSKVLKIDSNILSQYFLLENNVKTKFLSTDDKLSIILDLRIELYNINEKDVLLSVLEEIK
jgi:hypothetical protein